jgi:hypothetical protein
VIEIHAAFGDLINWAFPERYAVLTGGRGSGKSFALSLALALQLRDPGHRVLFTRYTLTSATDSIVPEFLEKIERLGLAHEFERVGANVRHLQSGSEILFRGIKTSSGNQTAKLKSLHGITVWVLDEADEMPAEDDFEKIDLSIRAMTRPNKVILAFNPPHVAHWLYARFWAPHALPDGFCGSAGGVAFVHTDYRTNIHNLPAQQVEALDKMAEANPERYRRVALGYWAREVTGALWRESMFRRCRPDQVPNLRRVVVALDPAATASATSDETGLIVAGIDYSGGVWVLEDATLKASPLGWATAALSALKRHNGDRIVAEVNNGGDMVEATIRQADRAAPYRAVHATRGKMLRAEPVAALYEQGRVTHVHGLGRLEAELITYSGGAGEKSPNRLDALVWAVTELTNGGGGLQAFG